MSELSAKVPGYMAQLLEELGWNQGTRIPLASAQNQELESLLIDRQNEVQRLKEAFILQTQKRDDLNKYKNYVQTEYQENTRLLFAHKQQMEQEVKLRQLSLNEINRLDRDVVECSKQNNSIVSRIDNLQRSSIFAVSIPTSAAVHRATSSNARRRQRASKGLLMTFLLRRYRQDCLAIGHDTNCDCLYLRGSQPRDYAHNIARLLKKADSLKSEVCGERGALQEWRAALERSAGDIIAIEQFTKQDLSRAKNLETKRQKLKLEHDHMQERLNQLVSNLSAEERACERISFQVMEGMEQRRQMMSTWAGAVENLRQRDTDIRHIREDYAVLDAEANNLAEKCREQQSFCDQQRGNNIEAQRENMALANQLSQIRLAFQKTNEQNLTLDSEVQSLQRELSNMRVALEKLHMENRQLMENQHRKDMQLQAVIAKIKELKEKLIDSTDKSKSSERRAKELEDILNEEERYASQITTNQQRAMHCSFVEQQKLLALKNEEKLFHMQLKASKAIMSKLDSKQAGVERNLQTQKESLYAISYQVETLGARVLHMEGEKAERECSAELAAREDRLRDVLARHTARVALLERHSGKLLDDMRRLARELELRGVQHTKLQSRLKTSMLNVEGGEKDTRSLRDVWRRARVEEALMRLRVAHGERALAGLGDAAFTLDKQRLQLDAAMNERLVEIAARREMFAVQRRALVEECGKLRGDIREREQRIQQLIKRYEIFIGSLGKDESGQQLSVSFFKIKFAAERAELREAGQALDADIGRQEKDISALEATLRVVHAAHQHFLHHISPLTHDAPEMEEVSELSRQYYEKRDELKVVYAKIERLEQTVNERSSQLTLLGDKYKQLAAREAECENEFDTVKERVDKQDGRLQKARELARAHARRAARLVEGVDDWRIFQLSLWTRNFSEAAYNSLQALGEIAQQAPGAAPRIGVLLSASQMSRFITPTQRRLMTMLQRIITDGSLLKKESTAALDESVFSESSKSSGTGVSVASGYTRRLAGFRRELAPKVQEHALIDDIREQVRRSSVSLRVVTLGLEESVPAMASSTMSRKSLR